MRARKKSAQERADEIDQIMFDLFEQGLASPEGPEIGRHFMRLQAEGHSPPSAKRLIGMVLLTYLYAANNQSEKIDYAQMRIELAQLPKLDLVGDGSFMDIREILTGEA